MAFNSLIIICSHFFTPSVFHIDNSPKKKKKKILVINLIDSIAYDGQK